MIKNYYIMIKKFKSKLTVSKEILKDEYKIHEIRSLNFKKEEQIKKKIKFTRNN